MGLKELVRPETLVRRVLGSTPHPPTPCWVWPMCCLQILFEDEEIIAVNKPAGMVVHPAPGSWNGTFVNALMAHLEKQGESPSRSSSPDGEHNPSLRPGVVHRLDKGTTGVLLAAKNPAMQAKLAELFANREVRPPARLCAPATKRDETGVWSFAR